MSGLPYRVRCGTAPPIDSQQWLQSELTSLRHAAALAGDGAGTGSSADCTAGVASSLPSCVLCVFSALPMASATLSRAA